MKLCKEMIEAMGGADSSYYVRFRMLACEAYNILRKSADLILSLFHLMAGASIEAIRANPENAMLKLQVRGSRSDLPPRPAAQGACGAPSCAVHVRVGACLWFEARCVRFITSRFSAYALLGAACICW